MGHDDGDLTVEQRRMDLLVRRTLDDLYWVMSYLRWRDPRFWPLLRDALLRTHSTLSRSGLEAAQRYNFERYHYQGVGRFEPEQVYARGLVDLQALAGSIGDSGVYFGAKMHSETRASTAFLRIFISTRFRRR